MSSWILESQLRWARRAGLEFDEAACVAEASEQLLCPLSPESRRELEAAHPGSTAGSTGGNRKAGALDALDSTLVLLCSLIEPVRSLGVDLLDRALGGRGKTSEVRLCDRLCDHGQGGDAGALESELALGGDHPVYVLARFREPWAAPDRRRPADPDAGGAGFEGLAGCRGLALDLRANPRRFARLEVARILEAIRTLTRRHGRRGFRLVHLWYDGPGPEPREYARELDRLRMRVGGDVEWEALTWRSLFDRLRGAGPYDDGYARRVEDRYFRG